jgi:hypothetical protein
MRQLGELLFIPVGWAHHVSSTAHGAEHLAVNPWWLHAPPPWHDIEGVDTHPAAAARVSDRLCAVRAVLRELGAPAPGTLGAVEGGGVLPKSELQQHVFVGIRRCGLWVQCVFAQKCACTSATTYWYILIATFRKERFRMHHRDRYCSTCTVDSFVRGLRL